MKRPSGAMVWDGKLIIQEQEKEHVKTQKKGQPQEGRAVLGGAGWSSSLVKSSCEEDLADHGCLFPRAHGWWEGQPWLQGYC